MTDSTLIVDATHRVFKELGNPQTLRKDPASRHHLWKALEDSGLPLAWVPESKGGAGASLMEGFDVLKVSGCYAVNVPIAETLLAGWLLTQIEATSPQGVMTIACATEGNRLSFDAQGRVSGSMRKVPFARDAKHIVVASVAEQRLRVSMFNSDQLRLTEHDNLAGDARDTLTFENAVPQVQALVDLQWEHVQLMCAVARAMQIAGAMQAILELSVNYANERIAFEKPIGKFQSIQHSLARLAAETAAALAAAGSAADAFNSMKEFDDAMFLEAASAKIRVGEAVATGAGIAHQVHGAIGFSQEHSLHCFTQRILAWRDDFGDESYWALSLGKRIARKGADALWPLVASR